ncbi:MAG: hypothetical protein R6W99_04165 [Clostridia bacterium]
MNKSLFSLFCITVFILVLSACNSGGHAIDPSESGSGDNPDIETSDIVFNLPVGMTHEYANYDGWAEAIKEKFGISVKINYLSATDSTKLIYTSYLKEAISEAEINGLVRLTKNEQRNIAVLREAGLILPLDEYLEGNEVFATLPSEMLTPYYVNDELWAIPVDYLPTPSIRLLNKGVLDELGLGKPETLSEFYEVLNKAKNSVVFKDSEGILITTGSSYPKAYYLKDIFYANACFISQWGSSSVSFDPTTNAYEDFMLKPEAADTLSYISMLLQNGLIGESSVNGFTNFAKSNRYLSYYNTLTSMTDEMNSKYEYLWYLKGSSDAFLNPVVSSIRAYVMTKDTPDPKNTINNFVNIFIGDPEGYYMGHFGLEDEAYRMEGDTLVLMNNIQYVNVVYLNSRHIFEKVLDYKTEDGVEYFIRYPEIYLKTHELLEKNILFQSPWLDHLSESYPYESLFIKEMTGFIANRGTMNVEDFIQNHISGMKKLGIMEDLDELNSMHQYTPLYRYSDLP